ncbi:PIN domain-containing protein [Gordonia sp. NPDC003504]
MLIHLDTNVLIRGLPAGAVLADDDDTQISSIVYAEFLEGLNSSDVGVVISTQKQQARIDALYHGGVPFDGDTARLYQVISGVVSKSGQTNRRRRIDLMIAATAIQHSAALATYNAADFAGLGDALQVIDLSSANGSL